MRLSQTKIDSYGQNGYLVVPGLVSEAKVEAIRADAAKLCRGVYPCDDLPPVLAEWSDEQAVAQYLCIHHPHRISPYMLEMVAHKGMAEVMTQIVAPDIKCMQSMLFLKPAGFPGQAWHQDEIYIPTRDRSLVGGWIALDDATVENGCLWVLPGSHAKGYLHPQREHECPEEFDSASESYGFDESGEIPVECKAGDVVFFNGYLLHRSRKNRSDQFRRVLVNHYMNAYSLLPWQMKPEERSASADFRNVIMVAGKDPYAWKGYERGGKTHVRRFNPVALETD
ncbi:MAG: phytanoyl-CoA dioxygenase family protein [bacterium]|nr:phytanoyl-CoA dioxygenase family protein [bacterium]